MERADAAVVRDVARGGFYFDEKVTGGSPRTLVKERPPSPEGRVPSAGPVGCAPTAPDPAGQIAVIAAVSSVFGAMVALALLVEIAYEWTTYSSWALPAAVVCGF